ncbi:MAG: MMPL family transporter [bacterium]|nr:MMPL family transporter [bacterium]
MRDRIEGFFESWGYFIIRFRWLAIAVVVGLTAFLASYLPSLTVDNSTESFLRPDDPSVVLYNDFRDQFARDDRILVAIVTPDVFKLEFLEKLRALHRDIENEIPYLQEVTSLLNARSTRGEHDALIVGDLVEVWPENRAEVLALRERVRANPLYRDVLISADETLTVISIKPFTYSTLGEEDALAGFDEPEFSETPAEPQYLSSAENRAIYDSLMEVAERHRSAEFPIHLGGALPMTENINEHMGQDVLLYVSLGLLAIFLLLMVLFRRVMGVVSPLIVVGLSLSSSLGFMVMLGIPGSSAVQMLPMFLLAVGVCDSVHILTIVYQELHSGSSKEDAIAFAMGHSGLAVLMTSVTTAAGMVSFVTAELAPVAHLGVIAPIGVMLALAYTLVLLPALLAIAPSRRTRKTTGRGTGEVLNLFLTRTGGVATRNPWRVLGFAAALMVLCFVGVAKLRFSHNSIEWFPPGDPLREAMLIIDGALDGTITLEVIIDSGKENGLHEPRTLKRIEYAMRYAQALERGEISVGKVTSIVDVVKETHQALNENRSEFYVVPEARDVIAQELLLFENSGTDDLVELVDTEFRTARVTVRVPWADAMLYPVFMNELEVEFKNILGGLSFEMTGLMALMSTIFRGLMISMARSYAFALAIIVPIMMLLLGSVRMGMLSMIPNLMPVVATIGLMGWLDMPLDASTIMIGAIIIGLAVDDTIHFMHKFQRYYAESGDASLAVQKTLSTTGAALLFTTLVLSAGFLIMSLSYLVNMTNFGILLAFATVVAFLADIIVAPSLMVLAARWKEA